MLIFFVFFLTETSDEFNSEIVKWRALNALQEIRIGVSRLYLWVQTYVQNVE